MAAEDFFKTAPVADRLNLLTAEEFLTPVAGRDLIAAEEFFKTAVTILQRISQNEKENIDAAAQLIAQNIVDGGVLHIFGAGHSHMLAEEITCRAGGLVPVNAILDIGYTLMSRVPSHSRRLERLEGYVQTLLEDYDLYQGEVLIVASQSGVNPGPIEAALVGREKGLHVVALTSIEQSRSQRSRHNSGKRLFEVAEIVIDNHVPAGDAVLEIHPEFPNVSAMSTVAGAAILQALMAEVAERILQFGKEPPVWASANAQEGDERNKRVATQYPSRLKQF